MSKTVFLGNTYHNIIMLYAKKYMYIGRYSHTIDVVNYVFRDTYTEKALFVNQEIRKSISNVNSDLLSVMQNVSD